MRQRVTIEVQPGQTLQVNREGVPAGQAITVPAGVSSVTVIFRDTASVEAAMARRQQRRAGQRGGRRRLAVDRE